MAVKDIMLDDDGDLLIENGDFVIGESDQQHILLLINTYAGQWKKFPTCGVGISKYLASANQGSNLRRSINVQLQADGYKKIEVQLAPNSQDTFDYYVYAERP